MKRLWFIALTLGCAFASPAPAIQDFSALLKSMAQCETSEQCIIVRDVCDSWTAINKRNEADYADFIAKLAPTVSCAMPEETSKPAAVECVNNFCEIH